MRNKYGNKKTEVDNVVFHSKKEADRYSELKLLLKMKKIENLRLQPVFQLIPAFVDFSGKKQQSLKYIADFMYIENGETIVEDVKGWKTKEYLIKRKMFLYTYPNVIFREI